MQWVLVTRSRRFPLVATWLVIPCDCRHQEPATVNGILSNRNKPLEPYNKPIWGIVTSVWNRILKTTWSFHSQFRHLFLHRYKSSEMVFFVFTPSHSLLLYLPSFFFRFFLTQCICTAENLLLSALNIVVVFKRCYFFPSYLSISLVITYGPGLFLFLRDFKVFSILSLSYCMKCTFSRRPKLLMVYVQL